MTWPTSTISEERRIINMVEQLWQGSMCVYVLCSIEVSSENTLTTRTLSSVNIEVVRWNRFVTRWTKRRACFKRHYRFDSKRDEIEEKQTNDEINTNENSFIWFLSFFSTIEGKNNETRRTNPSARFLIATKIKSRTSLLQANTSSVEQFSDKHTDGDDSFLRFDA